MSKAARDLEGYIEQALEGASRIRVWLIDNKPAADEARKLYGKATKMFDAISCLARGGLTGLARRRQPTGTWRRHGRGGCWAWHSLIKALAQRQHEHLIIREPRFA